MWLITFLTIFFITIILHHLFLNSTQIENFTDNQNTDNQNNDKQNMKDLENKLSKLESRVDNNEQVYSQTKNLQDTTDKNYNDIKKVLVNLKKDCHPLGYNVPECRPCDKDE